MITKKDFVKIHDYLWEIPKTFRADMRVPARIYADEKMLEVALKDRSVEQLVNTATLPGIVGYALAMPDIHQGYGFSIGGVAATRYPEGVISPGGVGYDINCLAGDSLVLSSLGYTRPIAELEAAWQGESLTCLSLSANREASTRIERFIRQRPRARVLRVRTASGHVVTATADHPFWTPDGMKPLGQIGEGEPVAVMGFDGVPYEHPSDDVILTCADVEATLRRMGKGAAGRAASQVIAHLKKRGLLPLRYSSPALPHILRLMGAAWGDGSLTLHPNGKGVLSCYGRAEDLEDLRRDVLAIGFTPSRVYARVRHHAVNTPYRAYEFDHVETWFKVSSTALVALLASLGLPLGNKARSDWRMPVWLKRARLWQKRLFLAALFGAEMSAPSTVTDHDYNFEAPTLSVNKRAPFVESGREWLQDIADLLGEFGVQTHPIGQRAEQMNPDGSWSVRLRLSAVSSPENLIQLWSRVGFECHREKRALASVAVTYLRLKQRVLASRASVAEQTVALRAEGKTAQEVKAVLVGPFANERFVERSLWGGRTDSPRIGQAFKPFSQFVDEATAGLGMSGLAWDTVVSVESADDYQGDVYDFTVAHEDHNFVAQGFLVSNCGVRLLASGLNAADVKPLMGDLISVLYNTVPSGVGETGPIKLSNKQLDDVLVRGAEWAVRAGYGSAEDLDHLEERGAMPGADPSAVSERAKARGRDQLGTLGSGNHFLEVQEVEEIYDEEAADALGLFKGQLVLQIHSGSRGLGHQVCTDYVRSLQSAVQKYGIRLPDRELVCAPLNSPEGKAYFGAMAGAANYAWANRQCLTHMARRAFEQVLAPKFRNWHLRVVYDVAHNIAKIEEYIIDGKPTKLCVHRKGATRAFGPGHPSLPPDYRAVGQPVLIPGDMGTASYVLVGTNKAIEETFGSAAHGAGRLLSRAEAKRQVRGEKLREQLKAQGIEVRAGSLAGLAEEAPDAYKDVDAVVDIIHAAGIARKVARLRPLAVMKG